MASMRVGDTDCIAGRLNGFIYEDDVLVGVQFPFTFALASDTPNDHVVPFVLTMTCKNGLNPDDSKLYTFESKFEMVVQRGRELPKIIDQDMTLTKQHYWIIDQPTFIPEGVTVTVTEGTQIQFWSPTPASGLSRIISIVARQTLSRPLSPPCLKVDASVVTISLFFSSRRCMPWPA